jgi:purine-nucleoside phosphorylase
MNELAIQIRESAAFINRKMEAGADLAIILGTGLGSLTDRIEILRELSFKLIPHFVPPTVDSHSGKLILAKWKGHKLWILSGRLHYYEGYTSQEITYPVRVLKELGVQQLWITNAAGTVNPEYTAGDIVFIEDHINFHPENPLRGLYDASMGDRFPDMSEVYHKHILDLAEEACKKYSIPFRKGIYFGLQGPSLETPAEYRMIRLLGADLVGMSTVPEVIVAHQCGLKIMAVSIVSNSTPDDQKSFQKTTMESVIEVIRNSSSRLFDILETMVEEINN